MFKISFRLSLSFPSTLFLYKFSFSKPFIFPFPIMVFLVLFSVLLKSSSFHNLIFPLGSVSLVASCIAIVRLPSTCMCTPHACLSAYFLTVSPAFPPSLSSKPHHSPLPAQQHLSALLQIASLSADAHPLVGSTRNRARGKMLKKKYVPTRLSCLLWLRYNPPNFLPHLTWAVAQQTVRQLFITH